MPSLTDPTTGRKERERVCFGGKSLINGSHAHRALSISDNALVGTDPVLQMGSFWPFSSLLIRFSPFSEESTSHGWTFSKNTRGQSFARSWWGFWEGGLLVVAWKHLARHGPPGLSRLYLDLLRQISLSEWKTTATV